MDGGVKAAKQTIDEANALLRIVCAKTDAFFTVQLRMLGVRLRNLAALQDSVFAHYAPLFELLQKHGPSMALVFFEEYRITATKYYERRYREALRSLQIKRLVPLPPTPLLGDDLSSGSNAHHRIVHVHAESIA